MEPLTKKRKVQADDQTGLAKQDSFSEILQQLEAEEDASGGQSRATGWSVTAPDHQITLRHLALGLDPPSSLCMRRETP
jgi:hypothetical protein